MKSSRAPEEAQQGFPKVLRKISVFHILAIEWHVESRRKTWSLKLSSAFLKEVQRKYTINDNDTT